MTPAIKPGYRSQAEDTHIEADIYRFSLLRQLTQKQRLEMAAVHNRGVRKLTLIGTKLRHQEPEKIKEWFVRAVLSEKFSVDFQATGDETMWIQDSIALAQQLHPLLESIQIPYYVTGGVAASIHGEPRSTQDLDLVIQINPSDITSLSTVLKQEGFYCPSGAIEDIHAGRGRMLSVTHMQTINNADIALDSSSPFDASKMSRRQLLAENFWLISPEDLILAKLLWGKGQSEKQWRDVLGILKVQGELLDFDYLWNWSDRLQIADLLGSAFTAVGL